MILTCSPYALIAFRLSLSFAIFNSTQNLHRTRAVHPFVNPFTVHGFVTNMSYQTVSLRTRKLSIHYLAPFRPHGIWTLFFIILSRRPYYRLAIIPFSLDEAFASLQTRMLRFLERRSWRRLYALMETLVAYRIIGSAASCCPASIFFWLLSVLAEYRLLNFSNAQWTSSGIHAWDYSVRPS